MEIHAPVILFNYYRLFRRRLVGNYMIADIKIEDEL